MKRIFTLFLSLLTVSSCAHQQASREVASNLAGSASSGQRSDAGLFQDGDFISISKLGGLEVQKHEITYAQYSALKARLYEARLPWEKKGCNLTRRENGIEGSNYAAGCISFYDAETYINALNAVDADYVYRLPTYYELAELRDMTVRALRDDARNRAIPDEKLSRYAWYQPGSDGRAHEVCTKEPVFDLCDILGNVWEWTSTPVSSSGNILTQSSADSIRLKTKVDPDRAVIGGSFDRDVYYFHQLVYPLVVWAPHHRVPQVGFRLVRTAK